MAFVAARVAPYKKVRRVEFVEQIPKSASGKILRRVLVERERASLCCSLGLKGEGRWHGLRPVLVPAATTWARRERLAEVERLFRAQLSPLRLHPGAALAVYRRGRLVLDLAAGLADTQRGEPVRPDTMFYLFSGTKPLASVALWQQIERGQAGLDDPVADHWPAFGQHGKERVTLRHVLSHRGGFPVTPPELTPERWGDWEGAVRAIADDAAQLRTRDGQRLPPADAAVGLRRTGLPPRRPIVRRLPAGGDHRAARDGRHATLGCRRRWSTALPSSTRRMGPTSGALRSSATVNGLRAAPDGRPGGQRRLDGARHGALLRRAGGGRGARRGAHPAAGDGRRACSASRWTARRTGRSTCRSAGAWGSNSADWPTRSASGPAPPVRPRRSGTAASAPRSAGATAILDLAMAFLTNGVRRDEAGADGPARPLRRRASGQPIGGWPSARFGVTMLVVSSILLRGLP